MLQKEKRSLWWSTAIYSTCIHNIKSTRQVLLLKKVDYFRSKQPSFGKHKWLLSKTLINHTNPNVLTYPSWPFVSSSELCCSLSNRVIERRRRVYLSLLSWTEKKWPSPLLRSASSSLSWSPCLRQWWRWIGLVRTRKYIVKSADCNQTSREILSCDIVCPLCVPVVSSDWGGNGTALTRVPGQIRGAETDRWCHEWGQQRTWLCVCVCFKLALAIYISSSPFYFFNRCRKRKVKI